MLGDFTMARKGFYDVAQICLNGHVINMLAKNDPIHNKDFCPKCGSQTIKNCLNCQNEISGHYYTTLQNWVTGKPSIKPIGRFVLPLFCPKCGVLFPWTEKKIEVSKNIIFELSNLTQEEKDLFAKSVDDIIKDTPETVYSSRIIKRILPKLDKEMLRDMRKILGDLASETAKKILFPEG
jgi:hypothetical protein